ncbi:hypothetical protein L083_2244 [Actinoplanes sp. N902-109]|nr:hypothetical protein L083_2244 [Actinoplanes sp. N902-109]
MANTASSAARGSGRPRVSVGISSTKRASARQVTSSGAAPVAEAMAVASAAVWRAYMRSP